MFRKKRINLAGQKVEIIPMSAKDGLETVIQLAGVLKQAIPYLVLLNERSRRRRMTAMAVMLTEVEGLSDVMFDLVERGTGLERSVVEDDLTAAEFVDALLMILRVNKWDELWRVAYGLRVIERTSILDFAVARLSKLRVR